jgi:peptidoglycan/LPS O-acetylase OafA/YrhL
MAILAVLLFHYVPSVPIPPGSMLVHFQHLFRFGSYGVDLFFVLSGFLIGGILLDARESPRYFGTFYLRRFHRIFPLYYLWLALYVILGLSLFPRLPAPLDASWPGWRPAIVYSFFLQNLVAKKISGIAAAWLGPLWSLAVEEQFYLVMPLAVRFLSRRRLVQILVTVVVVSPVLRFFAAQWFCAHAAEYVATPMRADGLALGALIAIALRDEVWRTRIAEHVNWLYACAVSFLGCIAWLVVDTAAPQKKAIWLFSLMALLFASIVLLALMRPQSAWARLCRNSALRRLGGISYCIYVTHLAVFTVCEQVFIPQYAETHVYAALLRILLAGAITWMIAKMSWRFLESPLIRRGHAYKY